MSHLSPGDVGVGKTTALAFATSILTSDGKGAPKPVFPTGAGRTTVCEMVIKAAPAFGVGVVALSEDEVRGLTRDLVMGLKDAPYGVSAEVARVLRNMSGMRIARVQDGEKFVSVDPILKMLGDEPDVDRVVDRLVAAMNLPARNETQLVLSEEAEHGHDWLAETITAINNGQHDRFSVPHRVSVLLPSPILTKGGIRLNVVDTRGIEGITQRVDLRRHLDDPRTLVVLCAKFPDAPNATVQRILKENEEAGSDAAEKGRLCLLVLPRAGEPMQISGDGDPVSSPAEGVAIRCEEITAALRAAALPAIPTVFFDAMRDKPDRIWASLQDLVMLMRAHHVDQLARTVRGVERLSDVDLVKSEAARAQIETDALRLIQLIGKLPGVKRHVHENLMMQFGLAHKSSIAASINRRGDWGNFPVLHILGFGVRNDANLRVAARFDQLDQLFHNAGAAHTSLHQCEVDGAVAASSALMVDGLALGLDGLVWMEPAKLQDGEGNCQRRNQISRVFEIDGERISQHPDFRVHELAFAVLGFGKSELGVLPRRCHDRRVARLSSSAIPNRMLSASFPLANPRSTPSALHCRPRTRHRRRHILLPMAPDLAGSRCHPNPRRQTRRPLRAQQSFQHV